MPNAMDKEATLRRNLADAGCDAALTEECLRRYREGTLSEILPKLTAHRRRILSDVHAGQKQIDCLDYLTREIKSQKYEKEKESC